MRLRLSAAAKGVPVTVIVFTVLALVLDALGWVVYFPRLSKDLMWSAFWFALALGGLAAIVVWRQGWAWWLCLLSELAYLCSPVWGTRFHPITDAIELIFLGLLVTPSMRAYVGVTGGGRREERTPRWAPSPGVVCLSVSGAGVLAIVLESRHHSQSVSAEVVGAVVVWLVLAAVLRLAVAIVRLFSRLGRRRGGTIAPGQ